MTATAPAEPVRAQRGPVLRCKGWRQESILRMLENNLEVGERPQDLVIYAGSAKAARDWPSFHRIVAALTRLELDQTLVVQSGRPVGIFATHETAPLVVMANGNVAGGRTPEEMYALLDAGLTIFAGMTAGAWQYIGSQGIIQGTYETFMAAARERFGGSLAGRTIFTAGCGGMGGAQPLAGVLAGASILIADVSERRLQRRVDEGYLERLTTDLDEAIAMWLAAAETGEAASIGVVANTVDVLELLLERDIVPDIVTDQTTTEPRNGYYPVGLTEEETDTLRIENPDKLVDLSRDTIARHMLTFLDFQGRGSLVFEYGNGLRQQAKDAGVENAFDVGIFTKMFIRPLFCEAIGPFRWLAIDGDPETIYRIDEMLLEMFADVPRVTNWLRLAKRIQFTGLPARICWLGHGERSRAALEVNAMVARGDIVGPVAFTRDHLDAGSASIPGRETEGMLDGSDAITDWALLNALLNGSAGADLIALHGFFGRSQSAGVTIVADGTESAAARIRRVLDADTGLGVLRYADAGYEAALAARERHHLGIPD